MLTQAICDAKLFMFDPDAETMPREALTGCRPAASSKRSIAPIRTSRTTEDMGPPGE